MKNFEKLGAFYLGRAYDADSGEVGSEPILYDSKDLTTHAVCVGMTGSGKTGLGVALLEEAIIDGIPVIAIDPKGDLGNMLLTFPRLAASDFAAVDGPRCRGAQGPQRPRNTQARQLPCGRKGSPTGARHRKADRKLYRDAAERCIYTPGSNAGAPISLLQSFAAPPAALLEDGDAMRERVSGAVSGLLALLGIDADPVRSAGAHPAVDDARSRLARGPRPGSAGSDPRHRGTALRARRGLRSRVLFPCAAIASNWR